MNNYIDKIHEALQSNLEVIVRGLLVTYVCDVPADLSKEFLESIGYKKTLVGPDNQIVGIQIHRHAITPSGYYIPMKGDEFIYERARKLKPRRL